MPKLASTWCPGWARRWTVLGALGTAFAFAGCDLNPQPEVPSNTAGGGGGGAGGAGGAGVGGSGAASGGASSGGGGGQAGGGAGGAGGSTSKCNGGCALGELCNEGKCTDDPCAPNSCMSDQACKPNADFTASNCVESCADVVCNAGETCTNGTCKPTGCASPCASDEVCAAAADGGHACVPDLCAGDAQIACELGKSCAPTTGACAPDPCNGVKCPASQTCTAGECRWAGDGGTGDGGTGDASDASAD